MQIRKIGASSNLISCSKSMKVLNKSNPIPTSIPRKKLSDPNSTERLRVEFTIFLPIIVGFLELIHQLKVIWNLARCINLVKTPLTRDPDHKSWRGRVNTNSQLWAAILSRMAIKHQGICETKAMIVLQIMSLFSNMQIKTKSRRITNRSWIWISKWIPKK